MEWVVKEEFLNRGEGLKRKKWAHGVDRAPWHVGREDRKTPRRRSTRPCRRQRVLRGTTHSRGRLQRAQKTKSIIRSKGRKLVANRAASSKDSEGKEARDRNAALRRSNVRSSRR